MRTKQKPSALIFILVLTSYFFIPLLWLVMSASKTGYEVETIPWYKFGQSFLLIENIKTLFVFPGSLFPRWMANSLIYSFSSSIVAVITCALAGFGLAAYSFKGKKIIQGIILFLAMVPSTALILPLYLMFAGLDLINTPWIS